MPLIPIFLPRVLRPRWTRLSHSMVPLVNDLTSRGLVAQVTNPELAQVAEKESLPVYLGVDPTARSLHAGNLLALMGLLHFQLRGHQVIPLIGGATGSIGDPGGRSTERPLLAKDVLEANVASITSQMHGFLRNASNYAKRYEISSENVKPPKVLNNLDWLGGISLLDFLRLVGKQAKVNVMLSRDSVKSRLETEQGISFTEFSYQLLQAYDFFVLNRDHGVRVQLGGSDQWGNIVAGLDLIRRQSTEEDAPVFGLTIPLLLTASGEKFGKSAGNAVWLDSTMTSVFDFYQFFLRVSDEDIGKYLRMFTLMDLSLIDALMKEHQVKPETRKAQRKLAFEVTELIHGASARDAAEAATSILFSTTTSDPSALGHIRASDILAVLSNDPRLVRVSSPDELLGESMTKLVAKYGIVGSRGEAKQALKAGGFYVNYARLGEDRKFESSDFIIDDKMAILRIGKEKHLILAVSS